MDLATWAEMKITLFMLVFFRNIGLLVTAPAFSKPKPTANGPSEYRAIFVFYFYSLYSSPYQRSQQILPFSPSVYSRS